MSIPKDVYTVSLYSTPMPFPLMLARHYWFVVTYQGSQDRYEVWAQTSTAADGTVCKNVTDMYSGCRMMYGLHPLETRFMHRGTLLWTEDDAEGIASSLHAILENSTKLYPYQHEYRLWPGPNSNTYIQWVLDQVPAVQWKLPWRAFGKSYAVG